MTRPVTVTVATAVLEDVQGLLVAAGAVPVNCVVRPTQTEVVPEIVGLGLTVNNCVMGQPKLLVYVMVVVPDETLVTKPVLETVASAGLLEVHGVIVDDGVPEPESWPFVPKQTVVVPDIVGRGLTVIVTTLV